MPWHASTPPAAVWEAHTSNAPVCIGTNASEHNGGIIGRVHVEKYKAKRDLTITGVLTLFPGMMNTTPEHSMVCCYAINDAYITNSLRGRSSTTMYSAQTLYQRQSQHLGPASCPARTDISA
ncbi:hypothetical protein BM1_05490 [Bipolaris maydis]|nr:hypothetical protein BM1_05490 [Bipolaris maydis]